MEAYIGKSIDEVLELLGRYNGKGKIIAGGTDIIISMRNGETTPEALIDISGIEELRAIENNGGYIEIGAGVTFTQIVEETLFNDNLYGLAKACRSVGSPQIRNRGTIGGNIANGSPAADSIPPLLCLDSTIVIEGLRGKREIDLEEYYKEHISIEEDELITAIRFKKPAGKEILSFAKLGLRKALAISRISIAILMDMDEESRVNNIKVSSGSLGRYPMREIRVEKFLLGKILTEDVIDESIEILRQSMDERLKGRPTLAYKRVAVKRVFKEALGDGMRSLKGGAI